MDNNAIKKIIEEILGKMSVRFQEIEVKTNNSDNIQFLIKSEDSGALIGNRGANLLALNHVIRKITQKNTPNEEPLKFFVDVNNYRERAGEDLKNKAKIMSDRARSFKIDIELEPMSSYERMLVHSFLEKEPDIKTESKGEGEGRHVVIKYVAI